MGLIGRIFRRDQDDCGTVRKLSSEYLERDLPQTRLERIRAHLDGCGPCRAFIDGLGHTLGLLGRLPRIQAPPSLKQSILERAKQEERGKESPS